MEKELLNAADLQKMGLGRSMVYQLLNRADLPVVCIGRRKFMHRAKFMEWLESQAEQLAG